MKRIIGIILILLISISQLYAQNELDVLLQLAEENNAGLAAKAAEIKAARERTGKAGAWVDPRLSVGYFIQPVETRTGPQRWRFSISQMFPWFGTKGAEEALYLKAADIAYLQWLDQREQLRREISQEYHRLWSVSQRMTLLEEQDFILQNILELAATRISSGSGKLSEHNRITLSRTKNQSQLEILQEEFSARYHALERLLQTSLDTLNLDSDFTVKYSGYVVPDSLNSNPGYQVLQSRAHAAYLEKEVVRQRGMPGIGAGLDYILVGERDDSVIPDNGKNAIMPMVTISLPIWRKKINSAAREAEWQQEAFEQASVQFQADRQAELELVVFELERALKNHQLANDQLDLLTQTLELIETDFANDQAELYDLLLIQQDILNFEIMKIEAIENYLLADASYRYLTWENFITAENDQSYEQE